MEDWMEMYRIGWEYTGIYGIINLVQSHPIFLHCTRLDDNVPILDENVVRLDDNVPILDDNVPILDDNCTK